MTPPPSVAPATCSVHEGVSSQRHPRVDHGSATLRQRPRGQGTGVAHAKAILFGEHAVVYGAPAIAMPLHQLQTTVHVEAGIGAPRIECELFSGAIAAAPAQLQPVVTAILATLEYAGVSHATPSVQILSTIPQSRGLGSSAAVAAATARAITSWLDVRMNADALYTIVQQAERVAHGSPSGLDAHAVTAAGIIRFDGGAVSALQLGTPLSFVLADCGATGSTATAVAAVRSRRDAAPTATKRILAALAELSEGAVTQLAAGDPVAIGASMRQAHDMLDTLGVSSPALNQLVTAAHAHGAHGAKLTGSGLGGCVIALADSVEHAAQLSTRLRDAGAVRSWVTAVPAQ